MLIVGYEITAMIDQGDAWVNAVDPKNDVYLAHTACAWNNEALRLGSDTIDLRYITPEEAQIKHHVCGYCEKPLTEAQVFNFLWCRLDEKYWFTGEKD